MRGGLVRCLLVAVLTAGALCSLYLCTAPRCSYLLLRRLRLLEARNSKLHASLRALSSSKGEALRSQGEEEISTNHLDVPAQQEDRDSCEVVHLSLVVSGHLAIRRTVVLVKSILFHRRNPIHLHLLTDARSGEILATIFKTWQLPAVNTSFYPLSAAIKAVEWIPTSHYSGVFGLSKLAFASTLPASLRAVIALDTDVMLAADIGELWAFARRLRQAKKLLGLVENQSDWYLGNMWKGHKPWPAVGRGFNTGVAVLNLELMRTRDWNGTWHAAARDSLAVHTKAALADQDVVNAAIKRDNGDLVFILPCVWNVQLSENTLSDYCFKSAHHFKIIHWNSAAKLDVSNIYGPHFKNLFTMFEDYDSMLFRTYLSDCKLFRGSIEVPSQQGDLEPCSDVRQEAGLVRRVHPYYLYYSYKPLDEFDVTLVTQMSVDRLHMLESLCEHWSGPLSIAVYAADANLRAIADHVASSPALRGSNKLALHVVSKSGKFYPVNHLRNIALRYVQTPYVYLSDVDFLPMPNLYLYLREAVRVLGAEKRALIVPAFESLLYRADFPSNKSQLTAMLRAGKLFTFRYHVWQRGHAATNFEHWKTTRKPYRVKWTEDFEPYLVVKSNVTRYDERFVGFGWNKVSHVMELAAQGYELVVLPEGYMVHMPHAPSADIEGYRHDRHYRDCMQVVKREFRDMLRDKYLWRIES